jgi:Ca2+-binding EF-hand superfamily protein
MRALGFTVQKQEVMKIMKEYDRNQTGKISYADFAEIMGEKVLQRDPEEEMKKAFALFDDDDSNYITVKNLRRVSRELGEVHPSKTAKQYLLIIARFYSQDCKFTLPDCGLLWSGPV